MRRLRTTLPETVTGIAGNSIGRNGMAAERIGSRNSHGKRKFPSWTAINHGIRLVISSSIIVADFGERAHPGKDVAKSGNRSEQPGGDVKGQKFLLGFTGNCQHKG